MPLLQYYPLPTPNTDKYTFLLILRPIIEFIRVKKYYGMPKGHLLSIYTRFLAKRELHCTFLGKKTIIITSQRSFFPITIFFWENLKKNWPVKRV